MKVKKKEPRKKHGNSKGGRRCQKNHPQGMEEFETSETNKAIPPKNYLEYSKDPKVSRFVFHPNAG